MSSRLSSISSKPTIREYAQGAAQSAIQPVADFLAPGVDVATSTGQYKVYTEKNRFRVPKTLRKLGGRATELGFEASDQTYNCQPHSLDYPIDNLEKLESEGLENILKEGATAVAEIAALAHELSVIEMALDSLTAVTPSFGAAADPIDMIDGYILDVLKAAKYGSLMGVRVLAGATLFKRLKNHPKVMNRFTTVNAGGGKKTYAALTEDELMSILIGKPKIRTSFMVYDDAAEGLTEDIQFVLDSSMIVFATKDSPTRRDPSFMKTFRLMGHYMVPGSYVREDGRAEVAKFDWSEDVRVTNSTAAKLITPSF